MSKQSLQWGLWVQVSAHDVLNVTIFVHGQRLHCSYHFRLDPLLTPPLARSPSLRPATDHWSDDSGSKCALMMYWTSRSLSTDSVSTAAISSVWCGFTLLVKYAAHQSTQTKRHTLAATARKPGWPRITWRHTLGRDIECRKHRGMTSGSGQQRQRQKWTARCAGHRKNQGLR